MSKNVDTIAAQEKQAGTRLLLRHCLSLGVAQNRVPARTRLDEAIGRDLAKRLVESLTAHSRR